MEELCDHRWAFVEDWEGDPAVIGGVREFGYYECRICGAMCEDPDEYERRERGEEEDE